MNQSSELNFSLQDLLGFLQRNVRFLVIGLLLGGFAGLLFAFAQTPQFQSAMTLQFSEPKKSGMSMDAVFDFNKGAGVGAAIPILQSRSLAEDAVKKLALNAELTNVSDLGYIKAVQRMLRRWINPPDTLKYQGWSGKTRFYLARLVGNPGPVGSLIINDLHVDSALQSRVLTLKLRPEAPVSDVADESGDNTDKCKVGDVCPQPSLKPMPKTFDLDVADELGNIIAQCKLGKACMVPFPNGSISFVPARIKAGLDSRIVMSFRSLEAAASQVRSSVTVEPLKQAGFLSVSYKGPEPHQAEAILNALAVAYSLRDQRDATRSYDQMLSFLDENIGPMEASLENAERRLRSFLNKHKVLDMSAKYTQGLQTITGLEQQRLENGLTKRSLAYFAQALDKTDPIAYGAMVSEVSPDLAREWEQLQQRTIELDVEGQALSGFTEHYPRMKKHLVAVELLKQRKDDLKKKALEGLQNKQQMLLEKERMIAATIENVEQGMVLDSETQMEYLRLARQKMVAEKLYGLLLEKREQMRLSKAGELGSMQMLDAPLTGYQVSPNLSRSMILGGVLGLLLVGFVTFVRETLNIAIKNPDEIERTTGLYVHGMIPAHKEAEEDAGLVTIMRPTSADAEAYRTLRTSIQLSSLENHIRSIMITSSAPGEGKSTTMANLAVTLAQAGNKTLVVDCDMRRPTLNKLLKVEREPGLAEVLEDKLDWHAHVKATEVANLFILSAGKVPSNPSELLGRVHMAAILAEMKQEYNFVLCDVPPILAVSDAALLASHLDGVLILIRFGRAVGQEVIRAREQMERVGGKVLGAVFNAYGGESGGYGRYGYGYSGYYHQDDSGRKSEPKWKTLAMRWLGKKSHNKKYS